jgi:hypothetical protein
MRSGPTIAILHWPTLLSIAAAALAAIPLVISRLDGDADRDPFFIALVIVALTIAVLAREPVGVGAFAVSAVLVVAWLAAAGLIAVLLVMYQRACACSLPDPASLPPAASYAGLPATAFHLLATYGGGLLVAIAVFGRRAVRRRPA